MNNLLIVGAGGHGKVIADTAKEQGKWGKIAFLDDRYPLEPVLKYPVLGKLEDIQLFHEEYNHITIAIGKNSLRLNLLRKYKKMGFYTPNIVHPSAFISEFSNLDGGCVILAKVVVNAGSHIGYGCIINTGATVDHDCVLHEGVHISPGVNLAGEVSVGKYSWIGIGSIVIQQIEIGTNVIVGAGSVVIKNIKDNQTIVGVPGRSIKKDDMNE